MHIHDLITNCQANASTTVFAATFIKFLPELFRAYEESKFAEKPCLDSSEAAKKYLASYFKTATAEKFVILYLDARCRLIKDAEIYFTTSFVN